MKAKNKDIVYIQVFARAKYADVYGNPYASFVAVVSLFPRSHHDRVLIVKEMEWGDATKDGVLEKFVIPAINEVFKVNLHKNDERIEYHYERVYRESQLKKPWNWKIDY